MSSIDDENSVDVVERGGYTDAGHGPVGDTDAFDQRTPLGATRAGARSSPAFDLYDEESITNTSSVPTLKRSSLKRSDGGGTAASKVEKAEGPSFMIMGGALVFFVLVMGGVGVFAAQMRISADDPIKNGDAEQTHDGVEVRRGIGKVPDNK